MVSLKVVMPSDLNTEAAVLLLERSQNYKDCKTPSVSQKFKAWII